MEIEGRTFYLAGPLNHETELGYKWRDNISEIIRTSKGNVKDPKVFEPGKEENGDFNSVELDKRYIRESDVVVVNFTDAYDNISIGTPMEFMYAYQLNKKIHVIGASFHNWVRVHADETHENLNDFVKYIKGDK